MTDSGALGLFQEILRRAVEGQASDIHFKPGLPPIVRVNDELRLLSRKYGPLSPEDLSQICIELTPHHLQASLVEGSEIDVAYSVSGLGRFRLNLFKARGAYGIVARFIPIQVRSLDELGLPAVLKRLSSQPRGLILVTGNTGSGKSTTLAAMINEWNQTRGGHIVTVEDPIEYVFRDKRAIVTQREVGIDTESFASGLKAALRQDPDVIMIGELRDRETVQTALNAAETGHLVLSTLHTKDSLETLNRVLGVFDPSVQREIRVQFASCLLAIVSQRLVPTKSGALTAAIEVMLNTPRVKGCMMDPGKMDQLLEAIEQGADAYGSQSFDQHLMQLLKRGTITKEVALQFATNPSDFELKLRGISGAGDNRWGRLAGEPPKSESESRHKMNVDESDIGNETVAGLAIGSDADAPTQMSDPTHTGMTESVKGLELDLGPGQPKFSPGTSGLNSEKSPAGGISPLNLNKGTKPLSVANPLKKKP